MSDSKRVIRDRFGSAAASYTASQIHTHGEDLAWLIEAHPLHGRERVLDVGTGTGNAAFAFAPYVELVEGIDITPAMLVQAEQVAGERGRTFASSRFISRNTRVSQFSPQEFIE
jgi:ubiquinone/menaquinone biosynthesis C-methylase UbiE